MGRMFHVRHKGYIYMLQRDFRCIERLFTSLGTLDIVFCVSVCVCGYQRLDCYEILTHRIQKERYRKLFLKHIKAWDIKIERIVLDYAALLIL